MADAIHISLAYFPFFTHKLEANFYQFFMEKNMCEIVKGMQKFSHCRLTRRSGAETWIVGVWMGSGWMFIPQHWVHNLKSRSESSQVRVTHGTICWPEYQFSARLMCDCNRQGYGVVASRFLFCSKRTVIQDRCSMHITSYQHEDDGFFDWNRFNFISDQFHTTLNSTWNLQWNLKHGVPKMNILMDWGPLLCVKFSVWI